MNQKAVEDHHAPVYKAFLHRKVAIAVCRNQPLCSFFIVDVRVQAVSDDFAGSTLDKYMYPGDDGKGDDVYANAFG